MTLTPSPAGGVQLPAEGARRIVHRTRGFAQGGITRLMSPGDLGELVKPFVFLDHFEFARFDGPTLPMHPHSGIATHTTLLQGSLAYQDSTGKSGVLRPQSVEWMQAGGGVWHTGAPLEGNTVRGFQLWVALPAEIEHAPADSHYVDVSTIPDDGRVRMLLGGIADMRSPIPYTGAVAYQHVRLREGERFTYQPPATHDVAWLAVSLGALRVSEHELRREMAVFEPGNIPIEMEAAGETELVIGSAVRHPHPLVLGTYSVHTSPTALHIGVAGIRRVAEELRSR